MQFQTKWAENLVLGIFICKIGDPQIGRIWKVVQFDWKLYQALSVTFLMYLQMLRKILKIEEVMD